LGAFLIYLSFCFLIVQYLSAWWLLLFLPTSFYLIGRYQFRIFPVSREIERAYEEFFFHRATLSQLRDKPELAIGSTNLQTCRPFTFSKRKMEDSSYAFMTSSVKFKNKKFPVARAVAASTCVPNFFTPIKIDSEFFVVKEDAQRVSPVLVDGGVYDNQGIQKLTQTGSSYECDIIITSDAGNKLPFEGAYNNTLVLLMRTVEAFMTRIKNFQMAQNLYNGKKKQVAYFSLGWDVKNCVDGFLVNLKSGNISETTAGEHGIPVEYFQNPEKFHDEIAEILTVNTKYNQILSRDLSEADLATARGVKTNLSPLSRKQLDCLIQQAANLTELQVRLYCPGLFIKAK
jgi:NTE family protein